MDTLSGQGVSLLGRMRQLYSWPILALDAGIGFDTSLGLAGGRFASGDQSGGIAPVIDAPGDALKAVITDIRFSADTAMFIDFIDMGNSATLFREYINANAGGQITLRGKLKLSTATGQLGVQTSTAGNISVTAAYYFEP